jgi:hypothetical protein
LAGEGQRPALSGGCSGVVSLRADGLSLFGHVRFVMSALSCPLCDVRFVMSGIRDAFAISPVWRRLVWPSVSIAKFATACGTLFCELRNRRTLATY